MAVGGQPSTDLDYIRQLAADVEMLKQRRPTIDIPAVDPDLPAVVVVATLAANANIASGATVNLATILLSAGTWRVDGTIDASIPAGVTCVAGLALGAANASFLSFVSGIEAPASADRTNVHTFGYVRVPTQSNITLTGLNPAGATIVAFGSNTIVNACRVGALPAA